MSIFIVGFNSYDMKNRILQIVLQGLFLVFASCITEEFETVETDFAEPILEGDLITMAALVNQYTQALNKRADDLGVAAASPEYENLKGQFKLSLGDTQNYTTGYVVSDDSAGNWFKEIVIQDHPEQPMAGMRVVIDVADLHTFYNFGRKVYVKLHELYCGYSNGVFTLGWGVGLDKIPAPLQFETLIRSTEIKDVVPQQLTLDQLDNQYLNTFVTVTNAQFLKSNVIDRAITFAGEATDQFDGERLLQSCTTSGQLILSTSTFADFKSVQLPKGMGTIQGVFTKNFYGDQYNMVINQRDAIDFKSDNRCDPDALTINTPISCGDYNNVDTIIFEETFEDGKTKIDLIAEGWVFSNIGGGTTEWNLGSFSRNEYLEINTFETREFGIDTWVVTPEINLEDTVIDDFEIEVQTNFNNGLGLAVYVTTDYVDAIRSATWAKLEDVIIPVGSTNGFGRFESAGRVNTSCITGAVRFALRYQGSDDPSEISTRYHVDNFRVSGGN